MRHTLILIIATMPLPAAARAAITATSGAIDVVSSPPSDVSSNQWESNTQIRAFAEQQNLALPQALAVDISIPGTSPSDIAANLTPATLPTGILIDSFMLHFDPVGSKDPSQAHEAIGSITFDEPILGIIALSDTLNSSNSVVGLSNVTYSSGPDHGLDLTPGGVGTGLNDEVILSPDDRTVTFDSRASFFADDLRIITAAPEPGTLVLAAMTAPLLFRRRRKE